MTSQEYWRQREAAQRKRNIADEAEYQRELRRIYAGMMDNIQKEIDSFYARYAAKEGITLAEAKRRAAQLDIDAYARKAKKYVKERDFSDTANEEMRLYNLTMKVNRLELLKANIGLELVGGFDELQKYFDRTLTDRTMEEFRRQAGILGKSVQNNQKYAHAIVNASFHNAKFSDRIWMHQDLLRAEIGKQLQIGLIQGRSSRELARAIRDKFNASRSDAERLMTTELRRVQTEAARQSYERNGNEDYTFLVTNPKGPCSVCAALDGKHFKVADMEIGVNAPPMHPRCHCATAPYWDQEEFDRWLDEENRKMHDRMEQGVSWEQEKKAARKVESSGKYGIIKTKRKPQAKISPDGMHILNPMDAQRYKRMKSKLAEQGCPVVAASGDDAQFLLALGAEAISDEYGILHLGDVPSASAFFEEIIHFSQLKKYGVLSSDDYIERAAREVAANRKLIRNGKAYGFTKEDFEEISTNLNYWEADFRKRAGVPYDEGDRKREI